MLRVTNYCRLCLGKNIKIGLKLAPMPVGEKFFKKKIQKKKLKNFPLVQAGVKNAIMCKQWKL